MSDEELTYSGPLPGQRDSGLFFLPVIFKNDTSECTALTMKKASLSNANSITNLDTDQKDYHHHSQYSSTCIQKMSLNSALAYSNTSTNTNNSTYNTNIDKLQYINNVELKEHTPTKPNQLSSSSSIKDVPYIQMKTISSRSPSAKKKKKKNRIEREDTASSSSSVSSDTSLQDVLEHSVNQFKLMNEQHNSNTKYSASKPKKNISNRSKRRKKAKLKPSISNTHSRPFRDCRWDIVYLTSSPLVFGNDPFKPLTQLNIKEERESFFATLKSSKLELRVIHQTATTSNIIAAVTGGCKCIHYSGHGYPQYLAFEDSKRIGETHLVHNDLIRQVCEDEAQRIEFVFASACHSEAVGQAFIEAGIQHVVAVNTKFEVTDEAASTFTKHFYNCILNGKTVAGAFKTAKNAVKAMRGGARADYNKFLLLPRKGDHNKQLFTDLKPGELIDGTAETPKNNLPPAVSHFVGRAIDMRHIIHQLMDSGVRLLVLNGDPGIGKSATALMVARYFCDRRKFEGGIFFIDVKKLNSTHNTLSSMLLKVFEECGVIDEYNSKKNRNRPWASTAQPSHHPQNISNNSKEDVFNIIRSMGEMLLVFDGLDQFGCTNLQNSTFNSTNYHPQKFNLINDMCEDDDNIINGDIENIEKGIQSCLQNIFGRTNIETKVLVTSGKKLHMFADFTNCIARYYTLRKLKPKDAAELFSLLCNQFRHTDIVSNTNLMRILEYNPLIITQIVQIKHQYQCTTLEGIVKAYNTKRKIRDKYENQQLQQMQNANVQNAQQIVNQTNSTSVKSNSSTLMNEEMSKMNNQQSIPSLTSITNVGGNIIDPRYERQMLAEKCIQSSPIAREIWIKACGMKSVHYNCILPYFQSQFAQCTGNKRPLQRKHLLGACTSKGKMGSDLMIQIQYFDALYMWFDDLCHLVQLLGDVWNAVEPCVMAGFISRAEAHAILSVCPVGTFIIRFSMTSNKSIAISYRDDVRLGLVQYNSSTNSNNVFTNGNINNGSTSVHVSHLKGTLLGNTNGNCPAQFVFKIKTPSQFTQMAMSLAAFVQIFSKISHLFDYKSQSIIDKTVVYFGDISSSANTKLGTLSSVNNTMQMQNTYSMSYANGAYVHPTYVAHQPTSATYYTAIPQMSQAQIQMNMGKSNSNHSEQRVRLRSHASNHSTRSSSLNQPQLPVHFQPSTNVNVNGMGNGGFGGGMNTFQTHHQIHSMGSIGMQAPNVQMFQQQQQQRVSGIQQSRISMNTNGIPMYARKNEFK